MDSMVVITQMLLTSHLELLDLQDLVEHIILTFRDQLDRFPAVALLGPRQAGKSTLARQIALQREVLMLVLESPADRAKLQEPELFLCRDPDQMLIPDEVQRLPGLFEVWRGVIDANRLGGRRSGQFLFLG